MPRALRPCPVRGCIELAKSGACTAHRAERERARGTAQERGYSGRRWYARRSACIRRDPICVCTDLSHGHGPRCSAPSTDADHDPIERRDLVAAGVKDPDAVEYLKGKCGPCHKKRTAATSPGGWNARGR
jgi:5-methylcytosine-specific restriction protein A